MVSISQIKQLRDETGLSISECKKALEEAKGDFKKAKEILKKWGKKFAASAEKREVGQGLVESYVHSGKRIGSMIELRCESDFVARSENFQKLAHELCLQLAAGAPEETPLLEQPWIKDESKTIKDLINEAISQFGENIIIKRFVRYEI
jgi:elongation factor Ts